MGKTRNSCVFSPLLHGRPSGKFPKMLKISLCLHRSSKDSLRLPPWSRSWVSCLRCAEEPTRAVILPLQAQSSGTLTFCNFVEFTNHSAGRRDSPQRCQPQHCLMDFNCLGVLG